jgi:hypothetical protein
LFKEELNHHNNVFGFRWDSSFHSGVGDFSRFQTMLAEAFLRRRLLVINHRREEKFKLVQEKEICSQTLIVHFQILRFRKFTSQIIDFIDAVILCNYDAEDKVVYCWEIERFTKADADEILSHWQDKYREAECSVLFDFQFECPKEISAPYKLWTLRSVFIDKGKESNELKRVISTTTKLSRDKGGHTKILGVEQRSQWT